MNTLKDSTGYYNLDAVVAVTSHTVKGTDGKDVQNAVLHYNGGLFPTATAYDAVVTKLSPAPSPSPAPASA